MHTAQVCRWPFGSWDWHCRTFECPGFDCHRETARQTHVPRLRGTASDVGRQKGLDNRHSSSTWSLRRAFLFESDTCSDFYVFWGNNTRNVEEDVRSTPLSSRPFALLRFVSRGNLTLRPQPLKTWVTVFTYLSIWGL